MQVKASYKTWTCVRTCDGWPSGFASRLTSSRKSKQNCKSTPLALRLAFMINLRFVWPTTCVDLRCLWSGSNLHASSPFGRPTQIDTNRSEVICICVKLRFLTPGLIDLCLLHDFPKCQNVTAYVNRHYNSLYHINFTITLHRNLFF